MTWITTLLRRPAIGWWDLVDILVVSVLIYELLKLIRGTRAVQMALGGGVLVALFYGSRWAHLETVNWLIRNLVGYLVFASGFLPRTIGVLMAIGGMAYLVNSFTNLLSPGFAAQLFPYILLPSGIAEGSLCLWLLFATVNVQRWQERADAVLV